MQVWARLARGLHSGLGFRVQALFFRSETLTSRASQPETLDPSPEQTLKPTLPIGPILLMDKILHDPKDPKLWELWYIPYMGNAGFCPSTVVAPFWAS